MGNRNTSQIQVLVQNIEKNVQFLPAFVVAFSSFVHVSLGTLKSPALYSLLESSCNIFWNGTTSLLTLLKSKQDDNVGTYVVDRCSVRDIPETVKQFSRCPMILVFVN